MNNIKIKILSPLHIGDNDSKTLSSLGDFIIEKNFVRLVDQNQLEKLFSIDENIMEDYINQIKSHKGESFSLKSFLDKYDISWDDICNKDKIPIKGDFTGKEIYPFISENGKRYLPGSTIKGAIRNALAYLFLKEHPEMVEKINNRYFKSRSNPNFAKEDKQIFGSDSFNDILKYLQVADSLSFSENSKAIYACKSFHLKNQNLTIPINYECILPEAKTELRIKIKNQIPFEQLRINDISFWKKNLSIKKIFAALNAISKAFIHREIEEITEINDMIFTINFYKNLLHDIENSNDRTAYFYIGKGTTIMEKTILLVLSKKQLHNLRNKMKITKAASNFGWINVNGEKKSSPKLPVTRLVYKNQNNWQTGLGWIKMEII